MKIKMYCKETHNILCDTSVTVDVVCNLSGKTIDYLDRLGAPLPIRDTFYGHGVATYKEGDINDIELAYKVAKKKAIRQAYKFVENYLLEQAIRLKENFERLIVNTIDVGARVSELTNDIVDLTLDDVVKVKEN